jgi:hypothetical protein
MIYNSLTNYIRPDVEKIITLPTIDSPCFGRLPHPQRSTQYCLGFQRTLPASQRISS